MTHWLQILWYHFTPHTRSVGWERLTAAAVALMILLVLVSVIPRRFSGPVLRTERWLMTSPAWRRWFLLGMPFSLALLPFALVVLLWHPRMPYVLRLESRSAQPPTAWSWEQADPKPPAGIPEFDPTPIIRQVLTRADAAGASHWSPLEPAHREELRRLCREMLHEFAAGKTWERLPEPKALPRCVEESVEMTVIDGIRALRNIVWTGVHIGATPSHQGWGIRTEVANPSADAYHIFAEPQPTQPVVHALYDGHWDPVLKTARFAAVVQIPSGVTARRVEFQLLQAGVEPVLVTQDLVDSPEWQVVTVEKNPFNTASTADVRARTVDGQHSTPLIRDGSTPARIPVSLKAPSADIHDRLIHTMDVLLNEAGSPTTLAQNLLAQGVVLPQFSPAAADQVQLIVRNSPGKVRDIVVLAPGLSLAEVQAKLGGLQPVAASGSSSLAVKNHVLHTSEVRGLFPDIDSWMSVAIPLVALDGSEWTPSASTGLLRVASASPVSTPLTDGRLAVSNVAPVPIVESGTMNDGKRIVTIRLAADEQGLLTASTGVPANFEPSRTRATVATIVRAIHFVASAGPQLSTAVLEGEESFGIPLFSDAELEEFRESGRAGADAFAVGMFGVYFTCLAVYYLLTSVRQDGQTAD